MDGIKRLSPLNPDYADTPAIVDEMRVRLLSGTGDPSLPRMVLCLFRHYRFDGRTLGDSEPRQRMESESWHRGILVTREGQRYALDFLQETDLPDRFWLDNSGKLIIAKPEKVREGSLETNKIRIIEMDMSLITKN